MKESYFQSEIAASVKALMPDAFYYKIPDPQYPKRTPEGDMIRRFIPRPYDCQIILNGAIYAMELKLHKKPLGFQLNMVKETQIDALIKIDENGGFSAVLINVRVPVRKINKIIVIGIRQYLEIAKVYDQAGRKSIPFNELIESDKHKMIYERCKLRPGKHGWPIDKIVKDIVKKENVELCVS